VFAVGLQCAAAKLDHCLRQLAESVGFEPTVRITAQRFETAPSQMGIGFPRPGAAPFFSSSVMLLNVRYWYKADIDFDAEHVRSRGQSGPF
jgi:hypothetical protein